MPAPRVCVVRAPGTNCDYETAHAFELAGGKPERVHVMRLLEQPSRLDDFQILCIPGGFSYGDDIGAGVIFAQHLRHELSDAVGRFLDAGKLMLGICNGFQVLLKSGLLPGGAGEWPPGPKAEPHITLTWNDNGKYTDCWVHCRAHATNNVFLAADAVYELPIAHAEGRVAVSPGLDIATWNGDGRAALRYFDPQNPESATKEVLSPPHNPNGSVENLAGLGSPDGRILGLMPHPERHIFATQHPHWTRRNNPHDEGDGMAIFRNGVAVFD